MKPKDRLIVALDFNNEHKALEAVDHLKAEVKFFKVGLELFSSCGPAIVDKIKKKGCEVFLDLKFHDIPNTVEKASRAVSSLGAFMFNVHALGGFDMMKRAKGAAGSGSKVIAVTILTSADENALKKCGISVNIDDEVMSLAALAKDAGLDGVVASPKEAARIRKELGKDFLIVAPGIRPWLSAAIDDQKRIATPREAIDLGADYIVVGRPIIAAPDPIAMAREILKDMIK